MARGVHRLRVLTPLSLFVQAAGCLAMGVLLLANRPFVYRFAYQIMLALLFGTGGLSILSFAFVPHRRMATKLVLGGATLAVGVAAWAVPSAASAGVGLFVGTWAIINALLQWIYAIQLKKTCSRGMPFYALLGLAEAGLGVALLAQPAWGLDRMLILAGVYLLVWAVALALEGLRELLRWDLDGRHAKLRYAMAPPTLATLFLPTRVMDRVNRALDPDHIGALSLTNAPEGMADGRFEVLFHFGKRTAMGFGHVDVCMRGLCYSYGCYDWDSHRLFQLLSDGVIAVAPKSQYIRYCIVQEKQMVITYSIYLTDAQEKQVAAALERIIAGGEEWTPAPAAAGGMSPGAPRFLQKQVGCRFYKLKQGPYQTYNAVKTNCVAVADMVAAETGIPLIRTQGIFAPGVYYAYLDRQFARRNSRVVKKTIYNDEAFD